MLSSQSEVCTWILDVESRKSDRGEEKKWQAQAESAHNRINFVIKEQARPEQTAKKSSPGSFFFAAPTLSFCSVCRHRFLIVIMKEARAMAESILGYRSELNLDVLSEDKVFFPSADNSLMLRVHAKISTFYRLTLFCSNLDWTGRVAE